MGDFDYGGWLEDAGLVAINKVDYSSGASPKAFGRGPLKGFRAKRGLMTPRNAGGFGRARNVSELSHQNRADLEEARSRDSSTPKGGRVRAGEVQQLSAANYVRYHANRAEAKGKDKKAARLNARADVAATRTRGARLAAQGQLGISGQVYAGVSDSGRYKQKMKKASYKRTTWKRDLAIAGAGAAAGAYAQKQRAAGKGPSFDNWKSPSSPAYKPPTYHDSKGWHHDDPPASAQHRDDYSDLPR